MAELRSKTGLLNYRDGRVENARFYYSADEGAPANRMQLDPEKHATWIESDGAVGRSTTSTPWRVRAFNARAKALIGTGWSRP